MPRGSRKGAKSRPARSSKASPYPKTRPVDPAARSRESPPHDFSPSLASPNRENGDIIEMTNDRVTKVNNQWDDRMSVAAKIQVGDDGTVKVTNKWDDKWDIAARIRSEVIERDLELRCSDGIVLADQAVLAAVSNFIKEILNSESVLQSAGAPWPENASGPAKIGMIHNRRKADLVIILLPDIDCHTMYSILACFYWGFIPLESSTDLEKVKLIKVAWKILQIDITISKLETVDRSPEIPGKQDARLVKIPRTIVANVKVKKEPPASRPRRQSTINTNYAEMDEDDPDDPSELPDIDDSSSSEVTDNLMKVKPELNTTYSMMEVHECIVCKGRNSEGKADKEASNLSFKDKTTLRKLREHYGKCFYSEGKIFTHVDPEEDNSDANGKVIDEFGKKYKYQCKVKGCWKQNKECGYKELAMHNAIEHGVLEKILEDEKEQKYINLLGQIKVAEQRELAKTRPLKCRVTGCPDSELLFENIQDYSKLQTHYAAQHFRAWFVNKDDGGKARNQKVLEPGRGTICRNCRERVYGNEELMMGHYASKHKRLGDAVLEGVNGISDQDARTILVDLYPDKVPEFDRTREGAR